MFYSRLNLYPADLKMKVLKAIFEGPFTGACEKPQQVQIYCFSETLQKFVAKIKTSQSSTFRGVSILAALITPFKALEKEKMCSRKLENSEGFVKIADIEIQVRACLDNLSKIKLVVPAGI